MLFPNSFVLPMTVCIAVLITVHGSTTTTLSRRLTMHLANLAIKDHQLTRHNSNLTRENIVRNTVIIRKHRDKIRLLIREALLIKFKDPNLNRQDTGNTIILQLCSENFPCKIVTNIREKYFHIFCIVYKYYFSCVDLIPIMPTSFIAK